MRKKLFSKSEFAELLKNAEGISPPEEAHNQVWSVIAQRVFDGWDGRSYAFLDELTPGAFAVACSHRVYRNIKNQDFITFAGSENLSNRSFRACEILQADEYLALLRQGADAFPNKNFSNYAEDVMSAVMKTPDDFFDKLGEKFVTGKGMKRPLHNYVFSYVTSHPEEFCTD